MLHARQVDMAVSGASSVTCPAGGYFAGEGAPLSFTGKVKSFSSNADGTVFTDGVGVGIFRRQREVEECDRVWSSICGYGMNQDGGARGGFSAPSKTGQARVLKLALEHAGVDPASIGYLECHATGTVVGDPIEVSGIAAAFGGKAKQPLLGCLKPNIGHANIASGMAGLFKVSLTLHHQFIPRTIFDGELNPLIEANIVTENMSFPLPENATLRRAGVSSFGIGGTNTSIILQEAGPTEAKGNERV
jgi:acyl transferase domain-containing protein